MPYDPKRVGRYRMLARLGTGGMGRVFLGSGPDGRLVALKLVSEDWLEDEGFRDRFRGEVAASRKVSGGYTAAVIDADAEAEVPWLASEYVPGVTLAEAVKASGGLPEAAVLRLAAGLAAALDVIHRQDLVHRDLKPTNILLTDEGLRVIDFGIARATDNVAGSGLTRTGRVVGTAGYMSPEQAEGKSVTPASDVFCLGTVLAMASTGSGPFDGNSDPQTIYNVVHKEPDLSGLPDRVRALVARCLDKDPTARPGPTQVLESIGELAPTGRAWPQSVHELINGQRAEVDNVLNTPQWTVNLARVVDKTKMFTRGLTTANESRRPAADAVNQWYDAAENRFRKLISSRKPADGKPVAATPGEGPPGTAKSALGQPPGQRGHALDKPPAKQLVPRKPRQPGQPANAQLLLVRDIAIIVAGALVGMFVTADLNIGQPIASDRESLGIGGSELEQALTHAGYFGAIVGFLLGGVACAIVRWIVGKRAQRFSRIALAVLSGGGFVLGWLAEHDYINLNLVSIGIMEDVSNNENEAGLIVLGVLVSFVALGCALWIVGRMIPLLAIIGFIPAAACGAAWAYLGASGIVIDDGLSIGLASVLGASIGGGVAARILNSMRDRKKPAVPAPPPPQPPRARPWLGPGLSGAVRIRPPPPFGAASWRLCRVTPKRSRSGPDHPRGPQPHPHPRRPGGGQTARRTTAAVPRTAAGDHRHHPSRGDGRRRRVHRRTVAARPRGRRVAAKTSCRTAAARPSIGR
ncbi:serine/threonine protein kinase [Stackebrandtia nassauensis DSM 44728]|uniref:non-specific serine/threonine protein kinase n=1 Tax=Stackebrandtia nassauensis (strain DSM 44728 / CIP 108903 / NRRL B-16338 / NBRC 102104 / LLR-40K-21) TaxID=446470 RepID=D3Q7M2_STANL|nr:serine/threonine protein kinase [Stackebrandtia nassauensis DSM 44728]